MLNHFVNYKPEVLALDEKAMELCQPYFRHMEEIRDFNQLKMLKAFADTQMSSTDTLGTTGYGEQMLSAAFHADYHIYDNLHLMQNDNRIHIHTQVPPLYPCLPDSLTRKLHFQKTVCHFFHAYHIPVY